MSDSAGNWCLIESDPGVFSELIKGFGVKGIECEEVIDLDYLDEIPDAQGFIFLYKWEKSTTSEGEVVKDDRLKQIFFAKQVITNACATQAIINILMNIESDKLNLGENLSELKSFCSSFDGHMKGLTLSNSEQIRQVHNSFSSQHVFEFEEKAASKDDDVYHFVGYISYQGRLYELDGLQEGPIDHGSIPAGENWVNTVKPVLRARMNKAASNNVHFNLMAVVPERMDLYQNQINDISKSIEEQGMSTDAQESLLKELNEKVAFEKSKVIRHQIENTRRRHNYLPFIMELLQALAEAGKLADMVEKAKEKADQKRMAKMTAAATTKPAL